MGSASRSVVISGEEYEISIDNPVQRYKGNPVLCCHDVNSVWKGSHLKVITVHNAGITVFDDKVIMLFRSHLRNGISVIGLARSENGLTNWDILPEPFLKPCTKGDIIGNNSDISEIIETESGGVEDARIANIDSNYYITYSAYHGRIKDRVRVSLACTKDFKSITRYGPVMDEDMRNMVIFPQKFNDKYIALFRPNDNTIEQTGGKYSEIRIGFANKPTDKWRLSDKTLIKQGGGPGSFSDKIGPGATPLKTKHGWINIFHGVRRTMDGNPYVLGVALHDLNNPEKVRISNIPVLFPTNDDCKVKSNDYVHVPNVVFTCGAIRLETGTLLIYYGGNDTVMNVGISHEDILAELCYCYPQDPETGQPLYQI